MPTRTLALATLAAAFAAATGCATTNTGADTGADAGDTVDVVADPGAPPPAETTTPGTNVNTDLVQRPGPKVDPIQVTIFNRFLIKPTNKEMPESEIREVVEETLGAKVVTLRRTAVSFWLVQLEATNPARTADDQQAIVAKLQATGAFDVVERDQIMTIK